MLGFNHLHHAVAAALATWAALTATLGFAAPAAAIAQVPVEICSDYYFVPITHSGDGDGETLHFLFDTGASTTYVDPDSLERFSGQRVAAGRRAVFHDVAAGPVTFNRLPARVRNLDHLSVALGREIDGILAFTVFRDFLLTLDYPAGEMRLDEGALPHPNGVDVFSARGRDRRPWIHTQLGNVVRRLLIDSGGSGGFSVKRLQAYPTEAAPRIVGSSARLTEVRTQRSARLDGDALLGPHRIERPLLKNALGSEYIGTDVLRHFVLTFDQPNRRVRITRPDNDAPITFGSLDHHGMVLVPDGVNFRVGQILADTPASHADIQSGDIITHIDGAPIKTRGCPSDNSDAITVTRRRGDAVRDIQLELVPLVD